MKKKLLPLFFAACLLALPACGGSDDPQGDSSLTSQVSSAAPATASPKPTASPTPKPKASPTPKASSSSSAATSTPEPTEEPTPEPTQEPENNQNTGGNNQVWVQPNDDPTPAPTPEPDPEPQANPYDYVGYDINTFYSVFGYPGGSDYGPSCMGPGEDGLLYYSNFTVYTYRENGVETIQDIG